MDGEGGTGCRRKEEEGGEPTVGDEGMMVGLWMCGSALFYLLMRYPGIVWGAGYPREQVGVVLPPDLSEGRPGYSFQ